MLKEKGSTAKIKKDFKRRTNGGDYIKMPKKIGIEDFWIIRSMSRWPFVSLKQGVTRIITGSRKKECLGSTLKSFTDALSRP